MCVWDSALPIEFMWYSYVFYPFPYKWCLGRGRGKNWGSLIRCIGSCASRNVGYWESLGTVCMHFVPFLCSGVLGGIKERKEVGGVLYGWVPLRLGNVGLVWSFVCISLPLVCLGVLRGWERQYKVTESCCGLSCCGCKEWEWKCGLL